MRRFFLYIIALFFNQIFALEYYPTTELYLNLDINYDELPHACKTIKKFQTQSFLNVANLYCDELGFFYPSPLDTTVAIGMNFNEGYMWLDRFDQSCDGDIGAGFITKGKKGHLEFSEVLKEEFLRLQELKIFMISKDSAENLISGIISFFKNKFAACPDIDLARYDGFASDGDFVGMPLYGCCSLIENKTDFLKRKQKTNSSVKIFIMDSKKIYLQNVKENEDYYLFDLNGKIVKQGRVHHSIIHVPYFPVILKIQNIVQLLNY